MPDLTVSETISAYLQVYADTPYTDPSPELVQALREQPEAFVTAISDNQFQKPANLDFRDMDDPLCRLLVPCADLVPDLIIPKMTTGFWATRFLYISSAAASTAPVFVPTLLQLLTDRSVYIQTLLLELILRWPHLQVPEALPQFEKLSQLKTFQTSAMDQELLERAKHCVLAAL
jgi:hypothetical protein